VPAAPALILGSALLKAIGRINFVENIEGRKAGMHCLDLAFFGHISTK